MTAFSFSRQGPDTDKQNARFAGLGQALTSVRRWQTVSAILNIFDVNMDVFHYYNHRYCHFVT